MIHKLSVCEISGGPVANGFLKSRRATEFQNPVAKIATANFYINYMIYTQYIRKHYKAIIGIYKYMIKNKS